MRRLFVLALALLAACGDDVAEPSELEDLRVLAIRTDPPEVFIDVDDDVQVRFTALVVDPREAPLASSPVQYTWSFCPVESNEACIDFDDFREDATAEQQVLLDGLTTITDGGTAFLEPQDQGYPPDVAASRLAWPYAITPFDLTLTSGQKNALAAYFLDFNFLGLGMGSLPVGVLNVAGSDDTISAGKRFTFSIQDVGRAAQQLGITLPYEVCSEGEDPSNGCVPLQPRVRNTNPTIERVQVSLGASAGGDFFDVSGRFTMAAGTTIRILPVMSGDSFELYQELTTNPTTGRIEVTDRIEIISVSWFATAGETEDQLTTPIYTKTLDTEFEAPRRVPPSGQPVSIYMVARDQRGGIDWANLEIMVNP